MADKYNSYMCVQSREVSAALQKWSDSDENVNSDFINTCSSMAQWHTVYASADWVSVV